MKNKELLRDIAERCKALREEKGVSQAEVAHDTGINIGRIETAERDISVSTLKKLCDYFEVSIPGFFS